MSACSRWGWWRRTASCCASTGPTAAWWSTPGTSPTASWRRWTSWASASTRSSSPTPTSTTSARWRRSPGPHGPHHPGPGGRHQPLPARDRRAKVTERIQAPRGTFDVLPEDAAARDAVEREARRILESAGYGRIETPAFEATELFARGVGEATDIVRKEMYSFDDGGGRSLTLRPEGTAPVCRAYVEHGMHKLAQPVRLWYLSSFFRRQRAQAGRYRQVWQVGAEAIRPGEPRGGAP